MRLIEYKNWEEVITVDEFHSILNELLIRQNEFKNIELLEIADALSEKYAKFYQSVKLTKFQENEFNKLLIKLTDFTNLKIIEDLTGILFNFRLDTYYLFLNENCHKIKVVSVLKEVRDSIFEYGRN